MSVLLAIDESFILDHNSFISKLYKTVVSDVKNSIPLSNTFSNLWLSPQLFSILQNRRDKGRKRKIESDEHTEEVLSVKIKYYKLREQVPSYVKEVLSKYNIQDTPSVRDLAHKLFESTIFNLIGIRGGNDSDQALKCKIKSDNFLVPGRSRFFIGCVKEQCLKLEGQKFDILVADPPWWNKYIRRLKNANDKLSYSMMYNEDIASIPVKNLLTSNCLVAVWCTNAPSNIEAVKNLIFPAWEVKYITTWYWLKVSTDFQPICEFGTGCQKQPYERIMIGSVGEMCDLPLERLVVSVPSALHSHKPPLLELLSPYVKVKEPQVLELFARYLLPNTTSVGFEPLKWQHESLYETKDDDG